jgi:phage-related protein
MVTEQAGGAVGQFARESDSAAGSAQVATARWEDAKSALGTALLPAVSMVATALGGMAAVMGENTTATQILIGVVAGLAVAVLAVNAAMKVYQATLVVVGVVQKATWLTSPPFLVLAAVLALVAGIVLLWRRSAAFRGFVLGMWAGIRRAATAAAAVVRAIWAAVFSVLRVHVTVWAAIFRAALGAVRAVASAVATVVRTVWRVAFALVQAYVNTWRAVLTAAFNAARAAASAAAAWVQRIWAATFGALQRAASGVASVLAGPFQVVENAVNGVINAVRSLIGWLGRIKVPSISLPKLPGMRAAPALAGVGPAVPAGARMVGAAPTATAARPVVININGAVDPESTARQVRRLLDRHDRRMGLRGALVAGRL